jgi:hypothetical protein
MIEFDTTVRIGRTPGQVFSVLADFETYLARWAKGPVAAARTDGSGGAGSHYLITARDGTATVLTQSIRATPRGPFRLAAGLLRRHLQGLIASDLDRLKDLVEAEVPDS